MPSKIRPSAVRIHPELKADLAKLAEIDQTSEHSVYVRGLQDYAIRRLGLDPALAYAPVERPPRAPKTPKPAKFVDPDDAPELTDDFMARAAIKKGDKTLRPANGTLTKPSRADGFREAVAPAFAPHPKPGGAKKVKAK